MQEIIEILMHRDGISYTDAKAAYLECKEAMMCAIDDGLMSEVKKS